MSTPHRCPVCVGTGKTIKYKYGCTMQYTEEKCHGCSGTGIVWEPKITVVPDPTGKNPWVVTTGGQP